MWFSFGTNHLTAAETYAGQTKNNIRVIKISKRETLREFLYAPRVLQPSLVSLVGLLPIVTSKRFRADLNKKVFAPVSFAGHAYPNDVAKN